MKLIPSAALMVALCGACHVATADRDRVTAPEDALLVDVSPAERARVSTARVAHGKARDDLAAAQRQPELAASEQTTARQQHNAAVDRVAWARTALAKSETTGSTADVEAAQQELLAAENTRDVHIARCELRDREVKEAEMQVAVAKAQVHVATAELDLAKVVALNTLDRPETQKPDIGRFEAAVREAEGNENVARAGLAAAAREVEIGRSKLSEREGTR